MAARLALLLTLLAGCAGPMLASDGKPAQCRRVCIDGQMLSHAPFVYQSLAATNVWIYEDCCVDARGGTWSSCAWNGHIIEEQARAARCRDHLALTANTPPGQPIASR